MQNNSLETSFEKGANSGGNSASAESVAKADAWAEAMGEMEGPSYFGERAPVKDAGDNSSSTEVADSYNQDISDGAAILNYGLNGAAAQLGVGVVVEGIKNFNVSGSERPVHDLLFSLGIDSKPELKELRENQVTHRDNQNAFYATENAPQTLQRSDEGARKAIEDMQDLIRAVEKDDDDYADLREEAKANNKNLFEQAILDYKVQDLASLFSALTSIKQAKKAQENIQESAKDNDPSINTVSEKPTVDE